MKTIHKVLIPLFSVLLILSIVLAILTSNGTLSKRYILSGKTNDYAFVGTDFAELHSAQQTTDTPILPTGHGALYYNMATDGTVTFYTYADGAFTPYTGSVKTLTVKPELTYNKVPIKISYINDGETVLGYGLFTTKNSDAKVNAYSYVFAKLITAPTIYKFKGEMLLINTDPAQAFSTDKTYTDVFSVDLESGKCTAVLAQRDRSADRTGRLAERWGILTDSYLQTVEKKAGLISGRRYDIETDTFDFYNLNKAMTSPETKELYGLFLREAEDSGLVYLKKTAEGFMSVKYIAEEKMIASFAGDMEKDFVFSGDWVYDKNKETFTNLITGKAIEAKRLGSIDMFAVNADGTKIAAVASYTNQAFFVIDGEGKFDGYAGDLIFNTNVQNICFADNDTVLTTAVQSDDSCINYLTKI